MQRDKKHLSYVSACAVIVGMLSVVYACGLVDPKYVNYAEESEPVETPPDPTEPDECQLAALAAFNEHIQAAMGTCASSGCHGGTYEIGGASLNEGDAAISRVTLLDFSQGVAETLFSAYTDGHGGGDQSAVLPLSSVEAWLEAEAECE